MPDEQEDLLLLGTIHIDVFFDEAGDIMQSATIEGLDTYQAVGVLEHVKMDQLYFPGTEEDE